MHFCKVFDSGSELLYLMSCSIYAGEVGQKAVRHALEECFGSEWEKKVKCDIEQDGQEWEEWEEEESEEEGMPEEEDAEAEWGAEGVEVQPGVLAARKGLCSSMQYMRGMKVQHNLETNYGDAENDM